MFRSFREKEFYHPLLIWLMVLCWYLFLGHNLLASPETKLADTIDAQSFWFLNEPPKEADDVTIVAIDQTSRRQLDMKWPWERSLTAKLIRNITAFSPQAVGVDIIFSGTSEESQDRELVSALRTHPRIVLGYTRQEISPDRPYEMFATAVVSSTGFVDKPLDAGLVREIMTYYRDHSKNLHFSMDVQLAKAYLGLDEHDIGINKEGVFLSDKLFIPSPKGRTSLNYLVYPTSFRIIPASQVLDNTASPSDFRNKIVLVGATDPLIHDEHPTILGNIPGVTILGNALVMLLSKRFLRPAPAGSGLLVALALGGLILVINTKFSVLRASFISIGLLILVYLSFILLRGMDITLPYFLILFAGGTAFVAFNGYKHISLLYVTNKIRGQAILDPLTGLYAPRYFTLKLHEQLKVRKPFTLVGIRIVNFKKLSIDLNFDQLKKLIKRLSTSLSDELDEHFSNTSLSRLSTDTLGIGIEEETSGKIEAFWNGFMQRVENAKIEMGTKKPANALKACFIYKAKDRIGTKTDLLCQMDDLLKNGEKGTYCFENLKQGENHARPAISRMGMLDFITFDWEERNRELESRLRELMEANKELNKLNWGTLNALARAIDAKSPWTAGHSERVTQLALKIGQVLGLNENELAILHRASLLHDIGKIATSLAILDKPGKLTDEEYRIVCKHPGVGARILEPIEAYREIIPMVRQHHEWFNGKGYPDGIAGEALTQGGRILAVADVYDAVTSDRPYRKGMLHDRAVGIIEKGSDTQFDPNVVEAFLKVMSQGGSQVLSQKPSNHLHVEGLVVSGTNKTGKGSQGPIFPANTDKT